jgi:hypothetical protein
VNALRGKEGQYRYSLFFLNLGFRLMYLGVIIRCYAIGGWQKPREIFLATQNSKSSLPQCFFPFRLLGAWNYPLSTYLLETAEKERCFRKHNSFSEE